MRILSLPFLAVLIIVSFATALAFALGDGDRNLILIGVMMLSPLVLIRFCQFEWKDGWLIAFLLSIVLAPLLNQPESMRWSTVFYSMMFGLTFLAYKQLLINKILSIEYYKNILMYLIYAYGIVLLVQQFCILTGLPVFNESLSGFSLDNKWKLNSLAAEPSHSARIIALLMYSFITVKELGLKRKYNFKLDYKNDNWVWASFLWAMLTMGSGTAFLFIPIVLLKFIRFKSLIPIFILVSFMIFIVNILGINVFERTIRVFMAILTLDYYEILEADHSASIRILPMMILSEMVDVISLDGWFGHGVDFVSSFLSYYIPGIPDGFSGGGFLQIWMEYGFLSFILIFIFSFSTTFNKRDFSSVIFWFMLVFLYGVNSQIVWLCILLLFTNNYFTKYNKF